MNIKLRKWLRFNLRHVFLVACVVCVGLAYVGKEFRDWNRDIETANVLRDAGATVVVGDAHNVKEWSPGGVRSVFSFQDAAEEFSWSDGLNNVWNHRVSASRRRRAGRSMFAPVKPPSS